MTIIFDGSCGLCRPVVAVLRRLDVRRVVEFLDLHSDWLLIQRRFPALSRVACLTEMHGIDRSGRVVKGFDTYRALAWILPPGWLVLPLLYLPGVGWTGRRVFRAIANHRHDAVCGRPRTIRMDQPNHPLELYPNEMLLIPGLSAPRGKGLPRRAGVQYGTARLGASRILLGCEYPSNHRRPQSIPRRELPG